MAQALLPVDLQVKGGAVQTILIGLILMLVLIFREHGLIGEEAVMSHEAKLESGGSASWRRFALVRPPGARRPARAR